MSPIADTISAMFDRAPAALWAWVLFGLVPVLVPGLASLFVKAPARSRLGFTLSCAARLLGWPLLCIALIGVPWALFELFLVPVLFDAYPVSKSILATPLAWAHELMSLWPLVVPVLWIVWLAVGTARAQRAWRAR